MKPVIIIACNIILGDIYSKLDITMLGYWKTDAVTGYYANAFKIINIIISLCIAMTDVFLPRLSSIYCRSKEEYQRLLNQGVHIVLAIVFPAAIGLSLLTPILIPILFGQTFLPAIVTVIGFSPLILIKGFGNLACYQVAISSGNEKKQTVAYIFGCLVNVVLNAMLIPILNQNGAVIASVASEFVLNAILFFQLRKVSGIRIKWRYLATVLESTLMMGIVLKFILQFMPNLLGVMLAVLLGGSIYLISGYFFKNELILHIVNKIKKRAVC